MIMSVLAMQERNLKKIMAHLFIHANIYTAPSPLHQLKNILYMNILSSHNVVTTIVESHTSLTKLVVFIHHQLCFPSLYMRPIRK